MQQVSEPTHHLLQRLFDLSAKASWFVQGDHDAEIAKVLEQVAEQGEPGAISVVFNYLFSASPEVRTAASRTVHSLLDRLPPERLRHLGDHGQSVVGFVHRVCMGTIDTSRCPQSDHRGINPDIRPWAAQLPPQWLCTA